MVDVTVTDHMDAPAERIATVMFDPARDPEWIGGAKRSTMIGTGTYGVGTRVRREGAFLGRKFAWVTEVSEFVPGHLVRMKHVSGPFEGGVDYSISVKGRSSDVSIRNYGKASFWFPFMGAMMRASVARDLRRLKRIVEKP
jgi:hypothetical protein